MTDRLRKHARYKKDFNALEDGIDGTTTTTAASQPKLSWLLRSVHHLLGRKSLFPTMSPHIYDLASTIYSNVTQISIYLEENGRSFPTFAAYGPRDLGLHPELESARHVAIDALQELLDLLQGPVNCMIPNWNGTSLRMIHRHDLARKVPLNGMISFQELANQCQIHLNDFKRIIRHAISFHRLFTEPRAGFVAHSLGSKMLVEDEILRAGVGQAFEDFYPAYSKVPEALEAFKDQEPNHTGFALSKDIDQSMVDYLATNPAKADQYTKAMRCFTRDNNGYSINFALSGYDWSSLGSSTVVDLGGGDGQVGRALVRRYARLRVIVQDLPNVIEKVSNENRGYVSDRLHFQAHDFFNVQPVTADAYLYRLAFLGWPDHYVVLALQKLVPVLRPGVKIVVMEGLSPEPGTMSLTQERNVRHLDMLLLSIYNSRLRSFDEWQQLFYDADVRYGTLRYSMPRGSALAILEAIWQP